MIPLPDSARQYTATPEWTDQYGLFEEDGINDAGVAMSATESAYANPLVLSYDPFTEHGINEEAMVTIVLPYVDSARAGVQRLGALVEQYGTGEANGILFADNQEAWYMEIATGHHWLAQRIPDDAYAVASNQLSIEVVDPDSDDFMLDPTLIDLRKLTSFGNPARHLTGGKSSAPILARTACTIIRAFGTVTAYSRKVVLLRIQKVLTSRLSCGRTDHYGSLMLRPYCRHIFRTPPLTRRPGFQTPLTPTVTGPSVSPKHRRATCCRCARTCPPL